MRVSSLALTLFSLSLAASGAVASDIDAFLACRDVTPDAARLDCYDRAAKAPHPAPSAAPKAPADFGLSKPVVTPDTPPEITEIKAGILRIAEDGPHARIYLDNGQVWEAQREQHLYLSEGPGNQAVISRSMLGWGYEMRINDRSRTVSVARVR